MGVNMRRILFAVIGCFTVFCAHAAQIVNVDYVHKLIAQEWDISIPIKADSPMQAANMKYLLTAVDVANEILNGEKTTDYGNGEFATLHAADTIVTNQAVDTLVRKEIEYKFFLTTTSTNSFSFSISAAGEFIVNWGDGKTETITKPDTTKTTYSHTYSTSKSYTIKLTGQATAYNTSTSTAAISFYVNSSQTKIASIDGSLGAIFGTLPDATEKQPRFYQTFYNAINMTGSIPSDLFAGISGAPAERMFYGTFRMCSGLTGAIPDGLFAGISGAPAINMFAYTFFNCSKLTSIPENLFGDISGTAQGSMFSNTFAYCSNLTGPSARINGKYLYEIWPYNSSVFFAFMYSGATKLSDYSSIPSNWK